MNDRNSFIILPLIIERCLITFDEGFFEKYYYDIAVMIVALSPLRVNGTND